MNPSIDPCELSPCKAPAWEPVSSLSHSPTVLHPHEEGALVPADREESGPLSCVTLGCGVYQQGSVHPVFSPSP